MSTFQKNTHKLSPLILILYLLFSACQSNKTFYPYEAGLSRFLEEEQNVSLQNMSDDKLLFMDISCEECILTKVEFLELDSNNFGIDIFIHGDTTGSLLAKQYKHRIVGFDLTAEYHLYETGISLPLFVHMKKGKLEKFIYLNASNQEEILEYLITQ